MPLLTAASAGGDVSIAWALNAARNAVWSHLADPAVFPYWLGEPAVAELWPDGRLVVDHGGGYICTSVVTRAKPGSTLAMSWRFPDEPDRAVTFETGDGHPDSEGCLLDLTHTALGDLAASYRIGWLVHLTYLEAAVHGTPLPLDQFWNLHATFAALHL